MHFLRDRRSLFLRRGQELYFDRWMGYRIGTKVAYFVSGSHYDGRISQFKARLRNATCERTLSFDPHDITDEYMEKFLGKYLAFRPAMIKCFPNALAPFASFVARVGVTLTPVQAISCTGENLYAQQREKFQEMFGGEVYEKVGTRESGVIACECKEHSGLHVFTEGIYLEILKEDLEPAGPGEMGRLVVTDLFNQAMPLIRYEIGDMAIASNGRICPCGSKLPLIEKLLGRDRDIVVDSYGNPKPGYLFVEAIKNMNLSAQIQVVQETPTLLVVRVSKQGGDEVHPDALRADFQKIVGPQIEIRFEYPDKIDRDPSGKFRYVISKVKYS
jgi:phenylacetate-CoA ligase